MDATRFADAEPTPATPPRHSEQVRRVARGRRLPEDMRVTVRLDRRTRLGRDVQQFRCELLRHIGDRPSAPQRALVELAVQLRARLVSMDQAFAERGNQSGHDTKAYLAWSNSLARALSRIGLKAPPETAPTLASLFTKDETDD